MTLIKGNYQFRRDCAFLKECRKILNRVQASIVYNLRSIIKRKTVKETVKVNKKPNKNNKKYGLSICKWYKKITKIDLFFLLLHFSIIP